MFTFSWKIGSSCNISPTALHVIDWHQLVELRGSHALSSMCQCPYLRLGIRCHLPDICSLIFPTVGIHFSAFTSVTELGKASLDHKDSAVRDNVSRILDASEE